LKISLKVKDNWKDQTISIKDILEIVNLMEKVLKEIISLNMRDNLRMERSQEWEYLN